ncbi:MAG: ABC transporter ATP-binding protein [Oscillospiraceae bacterium]|nr:ABC transporter ATP-binding protein [Oscillospiraceae bacterium]
MLKLARYLKNYIKEVIIGPFFKLIEAVFELIVPLVMAKIIDVGIENSDKSYILKMGGVMILLGVVGLCCALICQYLASRTSQAIGTDLRNDVFSKIGSLSYSQLDKFGSASLVNRIISDVNQLQLAVAMLIRLVVRVPFLIIGATVMAFSINTELAVIFVVIIPLVALSLYLVMSRSVPYYKRIQKNLDGVSGIVRENLNGVRVIRAFSGQDRENIRFQKATDIVMEENIRVGRISAILNPVCYVILNLAIIAILYFGGGKVYDGAVSQGEIIALVNYMTQISLALVVMANLVVIFTKAGASASRVNEIFDETPDISDGNGATTSENAPAVEFKDVCFDYGNNGEYELEGITFSVRKGETIGIIGSTGSGKSTLINLIPRFYDTAKGEVFIDGANVKDYIVSELRRKIGIVPQKSALFSGTVRENLTIGNENASEETIKKAIRIAQAEDIIERMPEGLETFIAEGGRNLSGGQRQRLTIARALVREPEILILDDSSSALDYVTDLNLRKAIKEETDNMTVFIVSQRANAIKNSDRIVVLDDGRISAIGKHEELLKTSDVYIEICKSQEVKG